MLDFLMQTYVCDGNLCFNQINVYLSFKHMFIPLFIAVKLNVFLNTMNSR